MKFDDYVMSRITDIELEIILLFLQKGYKNHEIAKEINISSYSVKYHFIRMFKKLNATNRTNLAYILAQHRIVED